MCEQQFLSFPSTIFSSLSLSLSHSISTWQAMAAVNGQRGRRAGSWGSMGGQRLLTIYIAIHSRPRPPRSWGGRPTSSDHSAPLWTTPSPTRFILLIRLNHPKIFCLTTVKKYDSCLLLHLELHPYNLWIIWIHQGVLVLPILYVRNGVYILLIYVMVIEFDCREKVQKLWAILYDWRHQ